MNKLTKSLFIGAISFGILAASVNAQAESKYQEQKVVYHVNYDENKRHNGMLGNIQNHINGVGADRLTVNVVMHGSGIELLRKAKTDPQVQAKIDNLKSQGVEFKVCANTMRGHGLTVDDLYDAKADDIVPAGVAEVAYLQQQGFVYLRP